MATTQPEQKPEEKKAAEGKPEEKKDEAKVCRFSVRGPLTTKSLSCHHALLTMLPTSVLWYASRVDCAFSSLFCYQPSEHPVAVSSEQKPEEKKVEVVKPEEKKDEVKVSRRKEDHSTPTRYLFQSSIHDAHTNRCLYGMWVQVSCFGYL